MKPKDSTAGANTTVTLPCVAFGIPLVQYTWYFNGRPMVWSERHYFSAGNLTIKKLLQEDMGIYQCFVRNKHGQTHADLQLTVSGNAAFKKRCIERKTNGLRHSLISWPFWIKCGSKYLARTKKELMVVQDCCFFYWPLQKQVAAWEWVVLNLSIGKKCFCHMKEPLQNSHLITCSELDQSLFSWIGVEQKAHGNRVN